LEIKVKSRDEVLGEWLKHLEGFFGGNVKVEKKQPITRLMGHNKVPDTVIWIRAGGHTACQSLNDLVDCSVSGDSSLFQEAAILASNMTGRELNQFCPEVFDHRAEKFFGRAERIKETGHNKSFEPEEIETPEGFEEEVEPFVEIGALDTELSEKVTTGTASITIQDVPKIEIGDANAESLGRVGEADSGRAKRRRGRPPKSDRKRPAT